jgi:translin
MLELENLSGRIHESFSQKTKLRDEILAQSRQLTRYCAQAIRAVHREEQDLAQEQLNVARQIVVSFQTIKDQHPDLYYAGYTQDAFKEFAEANLVYALINRLSLPVPEELLLEYATYLQGLAESVGELRRRCLDLLLHQRSPEAETVLVQMDDIYDMLVSMDYPDAITGGLRRLTDIARSIIERTRGDLTMSLRQERLMQNLRQVEEQLDSQHTQTDADRQGL